MTTKKGTMIRIRRDLNDRLAKHAKLQKRSTTKQLEVILEDYLTKQNNGQS
jgi:hypothetical protein